MNDEPKDAGPGKDPSFEVRYSEKFLRENRREQRRSRFFGAFLMLAVALAILKETFDAFRAHEWVDLGSRAMSHVMFPPIVGALFGLFCLCISLYFFWEHFFRGR